MNIVLASLLGLALGWGLSRLSDDFVQKLSLTPVRSGRWRIPMMAVSAGFTALSVAQSGLSAVTVMFLGFLSCLLVLSAIDLETYLLPNVLTLPLLAVGLLWNLGGGGVPLNEALAGAGLGFSILWLIDALYERVSGRSGMGQGDFKLMAALGAWCGVRALPDLILWASLIGVGIAAIGMVQGRLNRHSAIPFGPCLALAGLVVYVHRALGWV